MFEDLKGKAILAAAPVSGAAASLAFPALAFADETTTSGGTSMETITTALTTQITSVTGDITSAIATNLPAVLGVAAIFVLIPAVWRLVKRFTK